MEISEEDGYLEAVWRAGESSKRGMRGSSRLVLPLRVQSVTFGVESSLAIRTPNATIKYPVLMCGICVVNESLWASLG